MTQPPYELTQLCTDVALETLRLLGQAISRPNMERAMEAALEAAIEELRKVGKA